MYVCVLFLYYILFITQMSEAVDALLQCGMQEIVDKWNGLLLTILKAGFHPKKMQYGVEKMSSEESKDWVKLVTEEKRLELI